MLQIVEGKLWIMLSVFDRSQEGPRTAGDDASDDDSVADDEPELRLLDDDDLSELSSVSTSQTASTVSTADTRISAVHVQLGKLMSLRSRSEHAAAAAPPVQGPKAENTVVRKFSLLSSLRSPSSTLSSSPTAVPTSLMSDNGGRTLPDYVSLLHILRLLWSVILPFVCLFEA